MESGDTAASHSIKEKQKQEREETFKVLEALCGRIRKLLETGRVTDDRKRHCLAFMEMEVSALVEWRRLPPRTQPPWADCDGRSVHSFLERWLNRLLSDARAIDDFVDKEGGRQVGRALLQKAARLFRRRKLFRIIERDAYDMYCAAEECRGYVLSSSQLRPPSPPPPPPQAPKACDLVGIDGPARKLLRCLTAAADDDKSLRVMYIVGPTGVGKTTLAMELYRRLRCQTAQHFQCCAAASFSRSSDRCSLLLQSVLLQIVDLETLSPHNSETSMLDDNPKLLARSISERLQDKRYLILIDGICNDSDWEIIKGAFPNNNCGSQMLITTRDELMIRMCFYDYDVDVHNMEPLSDSDSERLLRTKAFGSMDDCLSDNMKLLCDEILTKCEGIPLFIIGMADWLKQHQQQQESSAVHKTDQVHLLLKQFRQMLSFECDDELSLPSLYLSMFPQGRVFDKHSLLARETVVKWFKIFSKLVDKNIITPVADCSLNVDEDQSCQWQVNPFMLHLFASKAAETGFAFTSTTLASARGNSKMTHIARHLALHHPDPQLQGMLQEMDLSHTRSLLISGVVDRISIPLEKFAYLVMLDLHGWENLKDEDLLQICKMFMLSYLNVSSTRISKLPPQIMELSNLKTLDISHTDISELPSEVSKLMYLQTLDLRGTHISQVVKNFRRLSTLLVGGNGAINSDETVVVTKIPTLEQKTFFLDTLATVNLSECSANFLEGGQEYSCLRSLAITCSFHQCNSMLLSTIQKITGLTSLTIHCGLGCSMEFLDSLNDPPKQLRILKVTTGRFVSVPRWIGGLEKLAFLQITICRLVPDDVKILANLKKLERLVLGLEFIPGEEILIACEGFKELQRFCLDCPVPWLTFREGAMPKLQRLQLKICSGPANQESAVPSGLTNLRSITEIVICYSKWCSNSSSIKMTVEAVRKQVAMHLNGIDLVIINGKENKTARTVTKNECESEDVEAFGDEAESVAECGTEDDFDAADEEAERRATHIQSDIEEIECETEIHA
ncbi:hypothetical protein GUJ93_ZPchr0006g42551 [Zizania palustris]|uniref:AAA+ ATPase domain-containing protein n=1 Tax=Zizania palustris TaxID=103762 RepID=A0A8J5VSM2_ZIZPA|nr:hypothetical protein GUJ93_ZPchr0006g42551 [Zizania palustris]